MSDVILFKTIELLGGIGLICERSSS